MVVFFRVVSGACIVAVLVYAGVLIQLAQRSPTTAELLTSIQSGIVWVGALLLFTMAAVTYGLAEIGRRLADIEGSVDLVLRKVTPPPEPLSSAGTSPTGRRWDEPPR